MTGVRAKSGTFALRDAMPADAPAIVQLVKELAEFEKLGHEAHAAAADFRAALFGPTPRAHAMLAEAGGAVAGLAIYFLNFSTLVGRHGLYVEDVFVRPEYRGLGIGRAFFRALDAEPMTDWTVQRLAGDALRRLAKEEEVLF